MVQYFFLELNYVKNSLGQSPHQQYMFNCYDIVLSNLQLINDL